MLRSKVSLTEFYRHLLPTARDAGFKLVVVALVRDADSPSFYRDIERCWSSLHDLTGPDILFLFAGRDASENLADWGLAGTFEGERVVSEHLALTGVSSKTRGLRYSLTAFDRYLLPRTARLDPGHELATDHTLEIQELRRLLGLTEAQLPCLAFLLLSHDYPDQSSPITCSTSLPTAPIYRYMKALSQQLEPTFGAIDAIRHSRLERQRNVEAERGRQLQDLRKSVRSSARTLSTLDVSAAVGSILNLTGLLPRSNAQRKMCWEHFKTVRAAHYEETDIIPDLQRLIDWSFLPRTLEFGFDENDDCPQYRAVLDEHASLKAHESRLWLEAKTKLEQLCAETSQPCTTTETWDFFIAYGSQNRDLAASVYTVLSRIGRPFVDFLCLKPGDVWPERLPQAQANSRSTIILMVDNQPIAPYQRAEYLNAIDLARQGPHLVIPILIGKKATLPYGLEAFQAVRLEDPIDLDRLSQEMQDLVISTSGVHGL